MPYKICSEIHDVDVNGVKFQYCMVPQEGFERYEYGWRGLVNSKYDMACEVWVSSAAGFLELLNVWNRNGKNKFFRYFDTRGMFDEIQTWTEGDGHEALPD